MIIRIGLNREEEEWCADVSRGCADSRRGVRKSLKNGKRQTEKPFGPSPPEYRIQKTGDRRRPNELARGQRSEVGKSVKREIVKRKSKAIGD